MRVREMSLPPTSDGTPVGGIAELWRDSVGSVDKAFAHPLIHPDEAESVDPTSSRMFAVEDGKIQREPTINTGDLSIRKTAL